jgi:hypothetical protein
MTIKERVDRLEANWGKTDPLVRELRDAVTVTAELERRQGKLVREHSEWLAEHKAAIKAHDEAMKGLDARIDKLVSGIGAFIAAQGKEPPQL